MNPHTQRRHRTPRTTPGHTRSTRQRPGPDHGQGREQGIATAFVVVILTTVIACAGLALDGARLMGSRRNAQLVAAAAARTGSQWFDETALNNGSVELDATAAIAEVESLLDQQGFDAQHRQVTYLGHGTLLVKVTEDVPMLLLGLVGITTRQVTASAQTEIVAAVE